MALSLAKSVYEGEKFTIIGFDANDNSNFIAINYVKFNYSISESEYVNFILEGCENSAFSWIYLGKIKLLPYTAYEENPPQQISLVHIADVLEDIIHEDETIDVEKIKLVIKSLREVE